MRQSATRYLFLITFLLAQSTQTRASAQQHEDRLRNSVGASYSGYRVYPQYQYIGAGIEYRYMHRTWIGTQFQVTDFPQVQQVETTDFGGAMVQVDAVLLTGHRWGKISLLQETGFGVLRNHVFVGSSPQFQPSYAVRNYPELLLGGFVDVAVARRWSLTFEIRDNMIFVGPGAYSLPFPPYTLTAPSQITNGPEGRAGFAFHF